MNIIGQIDKRLKALGLSDRGASLRAGGSPDLIRDIRRGSDRTPALKLAALARALECDIRLLLGDTDEIGQPAQASRIANFVFLPIRYRVQAGHWLEMDDLTDHGFGTAPLLPSPAWAQAKQWAEEIIGNSIDEIYPSGAIAHVVDIWDLGRDPRVGELVVVQRTRDGGMLRERTIKRLALSETGQPQLVGCSRSEPKWNKPIPMPGAQGDGAVMEVAIVGLVIGAYLPAPSV